MSNDVVYTPEDISKDIVEFFQPYGSMLEPCKGNGAFLKYMPDADWCELSEGRDFFDWNKRVNWIITNPPYSILRKFLEHSCEVADNIVFLVPVAKFFCSYPAIRIIKKYGGLMHVRYYGRGCDIGFKFGFPVGALQFKRGYKGCVTISYYERNNI